MLFRWTTNTQRRRNPSWNYPTDRHRSSEKSLLAFVVLTFFVLLFSYPSGRLAILRLRSPLSTVVFFDDTESVCDRFLGSITSEGHLTVQSGKSSRRRLFTDEENRSILSFDEAKGSIQREHQWNSQGEGQQRTALQIQLNSSIELQYRDPTDIRLTFIRDKEEYRLQLGVKSDLHSAKPPRPSSPFAALAELKAKAQQICHDWLEHSRTMLGMRSLAEYHLPDLIVDPAVKTKKKKKKKRRFLPLIKSNARLVR